MDRFRVKDASQELKWTILNDKLMNKTLFLVHAHPLVFMAIIKLGS